MSVLGLYVWKEWRDQRTGVIGMVVVVPLLFVLAAAMWSRDTLEMVTRPGLAASAGALLALLAVGLDLIPGELRRGQTRFLERLPAGLSRAFFAKFVFFGAFTVFAAVYAGTIACALHVVSFGTTPQPFLESSSEPYVLIAIACALWVFAVSAWVTHGALALPATVLVVAVLFAPMWFVYGPPAQPAGEHEMTAVLSTVPLWPWELRAFCVLSAFGAGVSAWASFVRGYRFGAMPARAARIGAIAAVLCLLPAWSWSAWRWYSTNQIVPYASTFHISGASLTEDGRSLFVKARNCEHWLPSDWQRDQTLLVDIETGRWKAMGGPSSPIVYASAVGGSPVPRVRTFGLDSRDRTHRSLVDGSGNVVEGELTGWTDPTLPTWRDLGLDQRRLVTHWGGLGFQVGALHGKQSPSLYDPFRKRLYDFSLLFPPPLDWDVGDVQIRPGSWFVLRRKLNSSRELFDPDTRTSVPVPSWRKTDRLGPGLADGRFVVGDEGGLCLFSPETGRRERLHVHGDLPANQRVGMVSFFRAPIEAFLPRLLAIYAADRVTFADLDVDALEVTVTASCEWGSSAIGIEDDGALLVLEGNARVVRVRFDKPDREIVFPR